MGSHSSDIQLYLLEIKTQKAKSLIKSCSLLGEGEDWMAGLLVTQDSLALIALLVQQNGVDNKHRSSFILWLFRDNKYLNTQWILDSHLQFEVLERETYEQTAVGWCMVSEENRGPNEGNIGLLNPHCNHLASEHLDHAAELFGVIFRGTY